MKTKLTYKQRLFVILGTLGLLGIVLLHTLLLANNIKTKEQMMHDVMTNKRNYTLLILLTNASQAIPNNQLDILNNLAYYNFKFDRYHINADVTKNPRWPTHLAGTITAPDVHKALKNHSSHVDLSYHLKNGMWLNYAETEDYTPYKLTTLLFFIQLLVTALILFYGWSLYRLKAPLKKFKHSADRLGIDVNAAPIKEIGPSMVRETANAMNKMQERIQELIKHRTKLLASISHDLKTPITRLKLRSQFIEDTTVANKITADLDEMQLMINGILSFARNDMLFEEKVKFDVVSLVYTISDDFRDMGFNINIETSINSVNILGRMLALKRCISNVIQNATKYAQTLSIYIKQQANMIEIYVEDDGPGIPEDELDRVFKAFYRAKQGDSQKSTGTGLGLTVAHEVIKDHQGKINMKNLKPRGLQVVIILPIRLITQPPT